MIQIDLTAPHGELATTYLGTLLAGDKRKAIQLILDQAESGLPVQDIYMDVFQVAQRELGRLWQTNQISVAQEHYCTAITQLIMSQLYPYVFSTNRNGHRLVMTCVGGELHEVGARMVADLFEMHGWDTYFMGANTPAKSVLSAVAENEAEILAVSATVNYSAIAARDLIDEVRKSDDASGLDIIVGGRPFLLSGTLWSSVGADGFAPDAIGAIDVANNIVGLEVAQNG